MKVFIISILLSAASIRLCAQSTTLYYAWNWEIVPKNQAIYYRTCDVALMQTQKDFFKGEVKDFTLDGRLIMRGYYTEVGLKEGEFTFYYPSGQIQAQGKFINGFRYGTWKFFFRNGQLEREVKFPSPERFKVPQDDFVPVAVYDSLGNAILTNGTGDWHFEYEWYGVPDRYVVEGKFLNGKKEGIWTCKLSSGQLLYQEVYKNNKLKEGFVSDGQRQERIDEPVNNKLMLPHKFEVTENFVYRMGTTQKDYPDLSFLPKETTVAANPSSDSSHRDISDEDKVFFAVEKPAEFPGGPNQLYKFIFKNLRYPASARRMGVEGKVWVTFLIESDGSVSNIRITRGINADLDNEAIRIVSAFPKWSPGMQNGRPVKSQFVLPIPFKLD